MLKMLRGIIGNKKSVKREEKEPSPLDRLWARIRADVDSEMAAHEFWCLDCECCIEVYDANPKVRTFVLKTLQGFLGCPCHLQPPCLCSSRMVGSRNSAFRDRIAPHTSD